MNKFQQYTQGLLTESGTSKLITLMDLKAGDVTIREGNAGEIRETVVKVEKKGIYYFYTVTLDGKEYTMSDRGSKHIRVVR